MGFQYTLASRLARQLGVRLEVVVPRRSVDVLSLVIDGYADVAAATLSVTPERKQIADFSLPLMVVDEMLVQPAAQPPVTDVTGLVGRRIHVRRNSSYWQTLTALQGSVEDLWLVEAPPELETEALIAGVGSGQFESTVADFQILGAELAFRDDVQASLVVGKGRKLAYAMRKGSPHLKRALDAFVETEKRGLAMSQLDPFSAAPRHKVETAEARDDSVLPAEVDALVERKAPLHGFESALIHAMIELESGGDPHASNWLGARGLLQVMPHLADAVGMAQVNLADPESGLEAGLRLLRRAVDDVQGARTERDQLWMGLAAYKVGAGHLKDARRLATSMGLDAGQWSEHVERAMVALERAAVAATTRYGYCRGREVVGYVDEIAARLESKR